MIVNWPLLHRFIERESQFKKKKRKKINFWTSAESLIGWSIIFFFHFIYDKEYICRTIHNENFF